MSAPAWIRWRGALAALLLCAVPASAQPQRIVSLAPSVTEVLFAVGLGPRVVAVTSYCRYPPAALRLPKIGGYLTPSYEALVSAAPDLAVVLSEHADIEPKLAMLRVPVLRLDHRSIEGVLAGIDAVGRRCGSRQERRRSLADSAIGWRGSPPPRRGWSARASSCASDGPTICAASTRARRALYTTICSRTPAASTRSLPARSAIPRSRSRACCGSTRM